MTKMKVPKWAWLALAVVVLALVVAGKMPGVGAGKCPGSLVYCPGVGCVSGWDKCTAGSRGGPSAVFSQEPFTDWPGVGVASKPPKYGAVVEEFTMPAKSMSTCPGGYRTDGPCLMEFK